MAPIVPSVFALLLAVNAASGLICYDCNSQDNVACGWGLTSFTFSTKDCGTSSILDSIIGPKCYKIVGKNKEGSEYVARGCLPAGAIGCNTVVSTLGFIGSATSNDPSSIKDMSCETCEGDKCNSAQSLTGVTFIGLILAAAIFLF